MLKEDSRKAGTEFRDSVIGFHYKEAVQHQVKCMKRDKATELPLERT